MSSLGLYRLTAQERSQLVEELLDSLNTERDLPPLTDAQRQDLDKRLAAITGDPATLSPWEDVEARILARLKR
jgi:putative addiction module component (TIGR02574 family)